MKRWIVFVALLWIAIWSAAPARADSVYYDGSHPGLIILGDADHYESGFRKSNGSIAYITDKTTGRSATRGSRYGCLWGASFPDGNPSFVDGCHYDTAGPNRFSGTLSARTQTLTLTYAPNPNAGQRVAAQVRIKPSVGSSLDIQLQLRNDCGHALAWVLFPCDTVFAEAEIREAAIAGTPGALDTTFNPGSGTDGEVAAIAVQPADGKVLIGDWFTAVNDTTHNGIARLNTNGSLNSAFNSDVNGSVLAIAVQGNHEILIGGAFTTVNGVPRNRIARLNADGTLATTFDPAAGPGGEADALALQPDGKIVIGGKFTSVGGMERKRIARLKPNGAPDASFDPGTGATWTVFAVTLLPDGRVLIGGAFEAIDSVGPQPHRSSVGRASGIPAAGLTSGVSRRGSNIRRRALAELRGNETMCPTASTQAKKEKGK